MKSKLTLLFVFLFVFSFSYANNHDEIINPQNQNNQKSLKEILNPDGTINTFLGIEGSFNPVGYKMISEPGKAPRFVPEDSSFARLAGDEFWSNPFSFGSFVAGNYVRAVLVYGTSVFVGGSFTNLGNVAGATNIAKWTGTQWLALGTGVNNSVSALAMGGTTLYVGGNFTLAGGVAASKIAKWNGTTWSALGTGITSATGSVSAIAVSGSNVYAGGNFTAAGGSAANYIAMFNGTTWSALGTGTNSFVKAISISGTTVYVGGLFTLAGGVANTAYIAKWSGSAWSAMGTGMNNSVFAISITGTNVYVGGNFTTAGGVAASNIAKWNGSAWSALGTGANGVVYSIKSTTTDVYIGGIFTTAGGVTVNNVAKWNMTSWSNYGSGLNAGVYALDFSGYLYVGGDFTNAGGDPNVDYFAYWGANNTWMYCPIGINGSVLEIAINGTDIFVGGTFVDLGGDPNIDYIARWDGSNWNALGAAPLNGFVYAIKALGGIIYVGGDFTDAGGNVNCDRVAKWNGTNWLPMSQGVGASVFSIETDGINIFVGGSFTAAGGVTNANSIAKWNGSVWSALGTGLSGVVNTIKFKNNILYAGGQFVNAGGDANADNIAKWNGAVWSSVGNTAFDYTVNSIEVDNDNNVYAGGCFEFPTYYLAKWNGTSWNSVGTGLIQAMNCSNAVFAIKMINDVLYVGGNFSSMGGVANFIAKWENNTWTNMGSGVGGSVNVLENDNNYLYAGGTFLTAGSKIAQNIARWGILPNITSQPNSLMVCEESSAVFNTISIGSAPKTFQWKHNGSNIIGATDSTLTLNPVNITDQGYYKCTVSNTCGSVTSDSVLLTVNAKPMPVISGNLQFCTGASTNLSTTLAYSSYLWSNSGSTSTIIVNTPGNYTVSVTDGNGCTNTSSIVNVVENSLPIVSAIPNSNSICLNTSTIINAFGANTYSWSPAAGLSSTTGNNVSAFPSSTTIYTITGTAGNGCQNTTSVSINVKVPFSNEIICEVNVDTATNHNFVVWEKTPNVGTAYFKIWKESTFGGIYTAIDSVAFDSMSIYTDMASNASVKSDRYKISVVDTCGNESNQSPAHKTLHLTVNLGMGNTINLIWENYEGFVFGSYYIYRGLTPATIVPIDTIQNTITTYTDIAPLVGYNYYKIIIANPDSCVASSNAKTQTTQTFNTSVSNMEEYKILPTGIENFGFNYGLNAYPNPYSNETNISYSLITKSKVKLEIYDLLGQRITEIINENQLAGKYHYSFSAKNIGRSQGVYFIKLAVDEQSFTKKLIETK